MILLEAAKTREGAIYLGGAVVTFLVVILTVIATVRDYQHQTDVREAVRAFAQGQPNARQLLNGLRNADGGDNQTQAAVRVMLGSYEYDRSFKNPQFLEVAERLFQEAHELDPERSSAAIGLACVRLTQCEVKDPDARHRDADAAVSEMDTMLSGENTPDAEYLRGASLILQGRYDKALEKLDDPTPSIAPTREGVAARHWNLGVALLMTGNPEAGQTFAMGYLQRPFTIPREFDGKPQEKDYKPTKRDDPARLLSLAWRVSLSKRPKDLEGHLARCNEARKRMAAYYRAPGNLGRGQLGRFLPHRDEVPAVYNALGLGFFHAGDHKQAMELFGAASKQMGHKEPLFLQNWSWSQYKAALEIEGKDSASKEKRRKLLREASANFEKICKLLSGKKGRDAAVGLARTNSAAIRLSIGEPGPACTIYQRYVKGDPNEAEWRRDLGALNDHRKNKREAIVNYRKAIQLQHSESSQLEQRVAELGG